MQNGQCYWHDGKKKKCSICRKFNKNKNTSPETPHDCQINFAGASGAMEAAVALELTRKVYTNFNEHVFIGKIVSDDDSSLRKNLRHVNHDAGSLEEGIPEPTFLADPSHRIKVMTAPIYKMVINTMDPRRCKKNDANRLKKYCSCYVYQNRHLPLLQTSFAKQRPQLNTYSTTMNGAIGNGVGLKISMRIPWR